MLSSLKKTATLLLIIAILILNNAVYGEQLSEEAENKLSPFRVYGKGAPSAIIPSDWKEESYTLDIIPSWSYKDKNAKYLVFKKSYLDLIYPNTSPRKDELIETLETFASLGEFEPATFCIKALENLESFRINVSNLINKDKDSVIDRNNIDIRIVGFFPQVIGKKKYKLFPLILEDKDSLNINKGLTQQYWLTIYVPSNTLPGEYLGKIILQADGISDKELILKVDVLPFKLKEPDRAYGVYYHMDTRWKGFYPFNVDKHFIDMKKHGLNTIALYIVPYLSKNIESINIDFSRAGKYRPWSMNELLKKYIDAGFDKTLIYMGLDSLVKHRIKTDLGYKTFSREYDEAFSFIVREIKKEQLLRNWPNFLFSPSDEPANNWNRMKVCKYYLSLLKEVFPDSKTYLTLNGKR